MKKLFLFLILTGGLFAQTVVNTPSPITFGAVGVAYNQSNTQSVAGNALMAVPLSTDITTGLSNTYSFTMFDAVPTSVTPVTVTTSISSGIAQKFMTVGSWTFFVPVTTGLSWNGQNTGWQWTAGMMAAKKITKNYYLFPMVRVIKSTVNNNSGSQFIVGLDIGSKIVKN